MICLYSKPLNHVILRQIRFQLAALRYYRMGVDVVQFSQRSGCLAVRVVGMYWTNWVFVIFVQLIQ